MQINKKPSALSNQLFDVAKSYSDMSRSGQLYGKLNMIVISEWMAAHLEKKAIARESSNSKAKHEFKTREEYENAVKVGSKINQEKKERKKAERYDEISYEEFKANYEDDAKARGINPNGTIED